MTTFNMGNFGVLPADIRLLIWEHTLSPASQTGPSTAIMRTSRDLYTEITECLYKPLQVHLSPSLSDPWLRITCPRLNLQWRLREIDRFWEGLWEWPYDKVKLDVVLYAPNAADKGEPVLLWHKVRALVAILQQSRGSKEIEILLRSRDGHAWDSGPVEALELLSSSDLSRDQENALQTLMIPFYQVPNVRRINITPAACKQGICSKIAALIADTEFRLDAELDVLPGHTASMLRLARFANWFEKPLGRLSYQINLLLTVRRYPATITAHDPGLRKLRLRYNAFDTAYLAVVGDKSSAWQRVPPCETLNPKWESWLLRYPDGIPALSEGWLCAERKRVFDRLELQWPVNAHEPSARTGFWQAVETYSFRFWGIAGSSLLWRNTAESRWCEECRRLGFGHGCARCGSILNSVVNASEDMTDDEDGSYDYEESSDEYSSIE